MRHVNVDSFSQGGMKYSLAQCIYEAIQEEFENEHLSGNLMNSIKIEESASILGVIGDGADESLMYGESDYTIVIEAQRYDLQIYSQTGQIVHTNNIRAAGKYNKSVIKRLKEGKSIDEISREDIKRGKTDKYYDDNLAGSYAEEVDITGGFSGTHKDYVERCIRKGIEKWKRQYKDLDISSNL